MTVIINEDECTGCGDCISECPSGALGLNKDDIAIVNDDKCNDCELCIDVCPEEAIEIKD